MHEWKIVLAGNKDLQIKAKRRFGTLLKIHCYKDLQVTYSEHVCKLSKELEPLSTTSSWIKQTYLLSCK